MTSRKRILHIVPDLGYGGVEKVILNYYGHLDRDKYVFDYVTHGSFSDYHRDLISQGSRIYYFKSIGPIGIKGYIEQIKSNVSIGEYDVIHVHTGHITGVYAAAFRKAGAKKIICHAHTTMCAQRKHVFCMPLFRLLAKRYSDGLIACGADAGKFCFGNAKFKLLPNGLDFDLYRKITREEVDKVKAELGIGEGSPIVGHVGRFSKQKNHSFIARVIHDYAKVNKSAKFVLVGDGPDRELIEKKVRDNGDEARVVFAGIRKDVSVLMKAFDIFIMPSLFEGLPVAGIEAQAAGAHCLFSNTIDKSVCISEGNCEFLPIDKGTEAWIDSLELMKGRNRATDDDLYKALSESGYEISQAACMLEEIYNSITRK